MLNTTKLTRLFTLLSFFVLTANSLQGTVYQTIADGNFTTSAIWSPSVPAMTWGFTDTVIINHDVLFISDLLVFGYFTIESSGSLTANAKTLKVMDGSNMVNNGKINVKTLFVDYGVISFINNDLIEAMTVEVYDGVFTNNGAMDISSSFGNYWGATFINTGNMTVNGNFNNYNSFSSTGDIEVGGNFLNDWSCTFSTSGTLFIDGNMTNQGTATVNNTFVVEGNLMNDWGAQLISTDSLVIDGNITNRGPLSNTGYLSCQNFYSEGSFTNSGTSYVDGNYTNKDDINTSGTLTITGNFVNDWSTNLTQNGNMVVEGDLINRGEIENNGITHIVGDLNNVVDITNNGNLFVDSSVIGSGEIDGSGSICNSDGVTDPTGGSKGNTVTCDVCSNGSNPLPVQLISFTANYIDQKVTLDWSTASEINNDYFEVLRTQDGKTFGLIARVDGNGQSNILLNYQSIDATVENGIYFYQLKQVDFDGKVILSDLISVHVNSIPLTTSVYPNPANRGEDLNIDLAQLENATIEIYDASGKLFQRFQNINQTIQISTDDFNAGMYFVRVFNNDQILISRFLIN